VNTVRTFRLLVVATQACAIVVGMALVAIVAAGVISRATVDCSVAPVFDNDAYGACGSDWVTGVLVALLILFETAPIVAVGVGLGFWLRGRSRVVLVTADAALLVFTWPFLWLCLAPSDWVEPFRMTLADSWPWCVTTLVLFVPILADWWTRRTRTVIKVPVWTPGVGLVWCRYEHRPGRQ
jgi:hypothetical protein